MVKERDIQPRKFQEADFDQNVDRAPDPRPVPPARQQGAGTPLTDIASGLALLLSLIAFFLSCYAAIQAGRRNSAPVQQSSIYQSSTQPISRPAVPFLSKPQQVEPGRFVQPTQDRSGVVELLSATRTPSNNNAATIQLRVRRLDRSPEGMSAIDLPKTFALNTRTNERYPMMSYQTPNDQLITLSQMRPGSSMNASVTVRVPETLDRIDLDIPNVRVFRNVPIS
jgi:hypothetical protein